MTRRHFIKLAKIVARFKGRMTEGARWDLADDIGDVCRESNYNFDRSRFRDACGVKDRRPNRRRAEVRDAGRRIHPGPILRVAL